MSSARSVAAAAAASSVVAPASAIAASNSGRTPAPVVVRGPRAEQHAKEVVAARSRRPTTAATSAADPVQPVEVRPEVHDLRMQRHAELALDLADHRLVVGGEPPVSSVVSGSPRPRIACLGEERSGRVRSCAGRTSRSLRPGIPAGPSRSPHRGRTRQDGDPPPVDRGGEGPPNEDVIEWRAARVEPVVVDRQRRYFAQLRPEIGIVRDPRRTELGDERSRPRPAGTRPLRPRHRGR